MKTGKILILEDNRDLAWSYLEVLRVLSQRQVVLAHSLQELTEIRDQAMQCDVAFLDINLGPGQPDGLDSFVWLKNEKFQGKIYFLTGHAMSHPLVRRACEMGAAEVLGKPMDITEFLNMIETRSSDPSETREHA